MELSWIFSRNLLEIIFCFFLYLYFSRKETSFFNSIPARCIDSRSPKNRFFCDFSTFFEKFTQLFSTAMLNDRIKSDRNLKIVKKFKKKKIFKIFGVVPKH